MQLRSNNPALSRAVSSGWGGVGTQPYQQGYGQGPYAPYGAGPYGQPGYPGGADVDTRPMTIDDVVIRTGMVLLALAAAGAFTFFFPNPILVFGGAIAGLILGLVIAFKQSTSPALILAYAVAEGLFLGGISVMFEMMAGVAAGTFVMQAVLGTIFAFGTMLALYSLRIIRVTNTFAKVTMGALVAGLVLVLANLVLGLFGVGGGAGLGLREASWLGVAFGVFMIVVACAVLAMDFKMIEDGIAMGMPNKFAWHCAFGLTVTLVWLYIEILRLLWMLYAIFNE